LIKVSSNFIYLKISFVTIYTDDLNIPFFKLKKNDGPFSQNSSWLIFRLFIIKKCPFLIQEMVNCISQLILLAHAGRIGRLPSLDTIEHAMKLSPLVVQALWDKQSPLMQLPHIEEDMLKHFHSRKRNIKTLQQVAKMKVSNIFLILFATVEAA
jgi:hypothetical protein